MRRIPSSLCRRLLACIVFCSLNLYPLLAQESRTSLELSRPVRSWEFLPVVGTRSGLFGNESGAFEAWVYPLKILRNFHLNVVVGGHVLPAESLARTLTVRPESSTILYASNTFSVRETLFVPVDEPGAVIILDIDTAEPVEVQAAFERDFQLEWPAGLGGTYQNWNPDLHAFDLSEEQKRFAALVGSPDATVIREEYANNYAEGRDNSFSLGTTARGHERKVVVIAGSVEGRIQAQNTYRRLTATYENLLHAAAAYYRDYLNHTVNLDLPDPPLQQAYDWSRISMLQGLVTNPYLGTGLIAGYRTAGASQRPGFAWFFGRDSLWTSLALNASGDFASTRTALAFLSKYQRADGKITHEIAQSASLVPWFSDYPYGYASADATPLYIIAANDYVSSSGDVAFIKDQWDSLWRAYQFLQSTYDAKGIPQNFGIGHGWVEGGPLLPIKAEFYQVGLGAEALRALSHLAMLVGKTDVSRELNLAFSQKSALLNQTFWSEEQKLYSFALDSNNQRVDTPSVLATVPMWFDLLDPHKSQRMIDWLAAPEHETDWGMRIISAQDPKYNPGGYHFGSVWPLFTGWASVGEYKYHRALPAYSNLRANAWLALNGSLGHVTEVLSGDFNEPLSTSSPHQIWSSAMVVSPLLRGMMGLAVDAGARRIGFNPHPPADWTHFRVENLRVGETVLNLTYRKTLSEIELEIERKGSGACTLDFSPAVSARAKAMRAEIGGHPAPIHVERNDVDQHVWLQVTVDRPSTVVRIRTRDDFGLSLTPRLPPLGSPSRGLRVVSESWDVPRSTLVLQVAGLPGNEYELAVWNSAQIASLNGSERISADQSQGKIKLKFSGPNSSVYTRGQLTLHFVGARR